MEIAGKIVQMLPLQTGEGKNGPWKKQDFVLETDAQYPKKVCIAVWGDKIEAEKLQVGNQVNVFFDVESREYNGRWYTDVKAWRIDMMPAGSAAATDMASSPMAAPAPPAFNADFSGDDDLPF